MLPQVPFELMATAYRRKRLMEGLLGHDADGVQQILQINEKQALAELQEEAARKEASMWGWSNGKLCYAGYRQEMWIGYLSSYCSTVHAHTACN